MEKRILIAAVLSIVVLFLYQQATVRWVSPPETVHQEIAPEKSTPAQKIEEKNPPAVLTAPSTTDAKTSPLQQSDEKNITIETPLYKAVFTSIGGGIKGFELKRYKETLDGASKNIDVIKPISMPLYSLQTDLLNKGAVQFAMPAKNILLNAAGQTADIVLSWESPEGIRIDKKYVFSSDTYNIQLDVSVSNKSSQNITSTLSLDLFALSGAVKEEEKSYHHGPIAYVNGNVAKKTASDKEESVKGKINWVALEDKFFISAVMPEDKENLAWSSSAPFKDIIRSRLDANLNIAPNASVVKKYTVYIGPKEYDILKSLKVNLEEAIDFGWFAFLARPFLVALNFLNSYIQNYGIVIILLTVIIKILFHPLTKQSLNSMKAMQSLQPQMTALREKYKDNKEKMNKELMELYKRNKVNPVGGCLPMVLQIPVFIALYNVLSASIEMRHAPFVLWIHDLSAKDPYLVTPILMGATMLWQQKMTPSAMDPQQAKVMLIMPIIFTFMFLNFPAGLVLYWLINNILSIAQQYYIQKTAK
ncbi:MAG: membrane protein insertase YidC [Deltaproteobacteria bacterium]|nr:membrane protein insertase YidC [Deltaproteobacteria bacterium]